MNHDSVARFTVRQLPSAEAWLTATELLRDHIPILMNLPGSVAESVVAGAEYEGETWLVIEDHHEVVGCACRTAPWPMVLGPLSTAMGHALGAWLAQHSPEVSALTGPAESVQAVAQGMGRSMSVRMSDNLRLLGTLVRQPTPGGTVRLAAIDDLPLLIAWFTSFAEEVGLQSPAPERQVRAAIDQQRLWVWEVGVPVAMGGHAQIVRTPSGTVGRIGPIYTRPEQRGRGYGSAITQSIATELHTHCDQIMLFADSDNRASNSIYERLGFHCVAEILEVDLT